MGLCKVLFICLGNICRSPTAEAVFKKIVEDRGFKDRIYIDSCGTGAWHVGNLPDSRAIAAAEKRGYSLDGHRARQLELDDYANFDYMIAMDRQNLLDINAKMPATCNGSIVLFTSFVRDSQVIDVPDPYYGSAGGFDEVINIVEKASAGLLEAILNAK